MGVSNEYEGAWCTATVDCAICSRRWVAVFPAIAPNLECPGCGYMNEIPNDEEDEPQ